MAVNSHLGVGSLRLVRLSKRFGDAVAVRDVSLDVKPGEFVTLLGPSGSGKTTTLNMVGGFEFPDTGEILIDDRPCTFLPSHKRGLGIVFQDYLLFPHLSVFGNVAYPLRLRRVPKKEIRTRVAQTLDMVQLRGFESRRPSQLSGGQQQRVALARALVFDPPVLLMDEPLGSLDKKLREEMQLELRRLHHELGITIVSVTHDQHEALTMSDRIAVMYDGRIAQVGAPRDVYERPATQFVANFIGESNVFYATAEHVNGRVVIARTASGALFAATPPSAGVSVGEDVVVVARPERGSFLDTNEPDEPNVIRGKLEEMIYVGDRIRCRVVTEAGEGISVAVAHADALNGASVGTTVNVRWRADDCILLPREEARSYENTE